MRVTSYFKHQRIVYGKSSIHQAWDFSSPANTPIYSSCNGKVISTKRNPDFQKQNIKEETGGNGYEENDEYTE